MTKLEDQKCTVCRTGDEPLSAAEIEEYLQKVPDWRLVHADGPAQIQRTFKFKDFLSALAFTQAVGQAAEAAGHHPTILTEWGKVTVTWWTHKIKGLHQNDFIMAAKTERMYRDR
jgi:4a-hydroxytetrahydrobiopterin dehydratase